MLNKEEIEKAKKRCKAIINYCRKNKECWDNEFCPDCYIEVEDVFAIEKLLEYIKELEAIKGMKEAIELSNMDIKSLLNLKYDNIKLHKMIDEMAIEINKTDQGYNDYCTSKEACDEKCEECIKQYFEKKVKEK